ncbi:toxin-antitoxin system HicB family antitoxin [Actinoplanes sp. N902-109]|uniref:toxin-antitoxin system HicB family antitoxin n=1 Tax=Actinoplanes sp. (strain N902-109) TaxID=649831 RepID=UPI0003A2954F|nr:toxin-antitoxin system HicB family antitoxin [Actinoplanes sp. N902-109]
MNLTTYVARLRDELANAAELGGPDARTLAERLTAPMDSAFRLALLDALGTAADEITRDLAPGSVQVRLQAGDPTFVVQLPPHETPMVPDDATVAPPPAPEPDDGAVSRINFRLPDQLKSRIEEAAAREGLSVNAWLVRAATAAVQQPGRPQTGRAPLSGQRFTGWAR